MITKKKLKQNPELVNVLKESISGRVVPYEGSCVDEDFVNGFEFLDTLVRLECPHCGQPVRSEEKEEYECHICGRFFEEDKNSEKGYRLTDKSIENFIPEYELRITENPNIFYNKLKREETDKFILLTNTAENEFNFMDRSGQFIEIGFLKLRELVDEKKAEELLKELKVKRKGLIKWERLETNNYEFQDLVLRLIDRDELFDTEASGGRGNDQGMDGLIRSKGPKNQQLMLQCKRNPGSTLSKRDIEDIVSDAETIQNASGVLIACINISGKARTVYKDNGYETKNINTVIIWQEEELKSRVCEYPHIVREFFF